MITAVRREFTTECVQYNVDDAYNSYLACRDFVDEKLWIDGKFASNMMQIEDPVVLTLDGPVIVRHGQWILKGKLGNFYILSNKDFNAMYKVLKRDFVKINDMPQFPDNKEPFGSPSLSSILTQKMHNDVESDRMDRMMNIAHSSSHGLKQAGSIISEHFQSPFELDKHNDAIDAMQSNVWKRLNEKL